MINWLIVSLAVATLLFAVYFVRCARKILAVNAEIDRTLKKAM